MSEEANEGLRVVVLIGTVRPGNYTSKAARLVADQLEQTDGVEVEVVDAADLELPFPGHPDAKGDAERLQEAVNGATGVVIATPEYHGGYSSVAKLMIENMGFPSALRGKPVALLGVAAGEIGAVKSLEALRGVCSHVGAHVLPGPVSVARVQKVFDEQGNCSDERVEKRVRGVASSLVSYIRDHICPRLTLESMSRTGDC